MGGSVHLVFNDRKYIDSLRFTSVTLIPIALLNGTLSHVLKTLLKNFDAVTATKEALYKDVYMSSWQFFVMFVIFYITALWFMGRRTGVLGWKRFAVVTVGIGFIVLYVAGGLMITPGEWKTLEPILMNLFAQ